MKTIDAKQIHSQINRCYLDYDPTWRTTPDISIVNGFVPHLEKTAGIKLECIPATNNLGRLGFEIRQVEIVNAPKFTLWLLRWT